MTDVREGVGASFETTSHEIVRQWARDRDAVPATVAGSEHDGHLGSLRFDFGQDDASLRHVGWDEWFDTFDARGLTFIYRETRDDGALSTFCRLESPLPREAGESPDG